MRQRNSYTNTFKTQVVRECLQRSASVASIALTHGINANVVRKRIPQYRDTDSRNLPAFTAVLLATKITFRGGLLS
jgi:transposase